METNGNGNGGGGVAVELPAKASDMAAIAEQIKTQVTKRVLAAFPGMGDEARRMVRMYIELQCIGGITPFDIANAVSDGLFHGKWQGADAVDSPGELWISGFYNAMEVIDASQ